GRIWWTWYYDERGKRHDVSTRCRDHRAATAVARRHERRAAQPDHDAPTAPPPAGARERFLADRIARRRSPATIGYYETKVGHLKRVLGLEVAVDDIGPAQADTYRETRLEEGAELATVAKELGALRGVLRLAARRGEYHHDPAVLLP